MAILRGGRGSKATFFKGNYKAKMDFSYRWRGGVGFKLKKTFMEGVWIFSEQHIFIVTQLKQYHMVFFPYALEDAYSCIFT